MLASVVSQDPVPFPHLGLVRDNKQQVTGNGVLQLASKDTGAVLGMGTVFQDKMCAIHP